MIEIKKLKKNDIKLALTLIKEWRNNSAYKQAVQPVGLDNSQIIQRLSDKNFHVFVASQEGKVLGGLTAYTLPLITRAESKMFLYEIEVQDKFRKKGIASRLIESLKKFCDEVKIKTIFLCTDLENIAAEGLYKKMGGEREIVPMYIFKTQ